MAFGFTGGADDLISLANVAGDFDLDLVGDTSSTITLNVLDVNSLDVTGDLELFGNITVDDRLDLSTNVGAINLNAGAELESYESLPSFWGVVRLLLSSFRRYSRKKARILLSSANTQLPKNF